MMPNVEYSKHAKENAIWALAQQDPDFAVFYAEYQKEITITEPLPEEFVDSVIAAAEQDLTLASATRQYQENANTAMTFASPTISAACILIASLYLISTHVKIHRTKDGKWEFLVEHNAPDTTLLEKIVQILSTILNS